MFVAFKKHNFDTLKKNDTRTIQQEQKNWSLERKWNYLKCLRHDNRQRWG